MQCKNCGALLNAESKVCTMCGTVVKNDDVDEVIDVNVDTNNGVKDNSIVSENEVTEEPANVSVGINENVVPTVPTQNNSIREDVAMFNNSSDFEQKKSKKGLVIAFIVVLLILLGVGGFALFTMKSPKKVFSSFINDIYGKMDSSIALDFDTMTGTYDFKINVSTTDETNTMFEILNNISLSGKVGIDYPNNIALVTIDSDYDNSKLLNASVYFKDKKGYILLNNIFDKYLAVEIEEFDSIFERTETNADVKLILKEVKDAINKSLKSKYFTKEKVDGFTKNTLVLNEKNTYEILTSILTTLKDKEDFLTTVANITGETTTQLKENIESSLEEFSEVDETSEGKYEISVYTKGLTSEFVKLEVNMDFDEEKQSIVITKEDEENYTLKYVDSYDEETTGKIKITTKNDKTNVSFSMTSEGTTIGFEIGFSAKYNDKIDGVNVNNSASIDELTEEEYNEIYTKLMEQPGVVKLMEALNNLSFGFEEPELECADGVDCYYDDEYYYGE